MLHLKAPAGVRSLIATAVTAFAFAGILLISPLALHAIAPGDWCDPVVNQMCSMVCRNSWYCCLYVGNGNSDCTCTREEAPDCSIYSY